ncbi:MAG: DUF4198 domain-containing protein [Pseudoxanthomonas sp.]
MKRTILLAAVITAALPLSAIAHKQWLIPSQAVVNGDDVWVTFDAAISNQLFHPDHVPMRTDNIVVTAPDGSTAPVQNASTGKYRSTFDVQLQQQGTYRIANAGSGISATWDTAESLAAKEQAKAEGKPPTGPDAPRPGGFLRGATVEDLSTKVPKDARNLQVTESAYRVETFVTNADTTPVRPIGKGLELVPVTHPNDLFAGEAATFKIHLDGKPAAGLEIEAIRGGTRYRNAQGELKAVTDANGQFSLTWPEAGLYWLETGTRDDKTSVKQASQRRLTYVVTLEVLPQ